MILVTGGTGFIGSHLLEKLVAAREPVRCLVRPKATPRRLPAGVECVPGDLTTGAGLDDALRGADIVIHLAGVTKVIRREEFDLGNARATETLVKALAAHSAWSMSVRWLRSVRAWMECLWRRTRRRIPSRSMDARNWKPNGSSGSLHRQQ